MRGTDNVKRVGLRISLEIDKWFEVRSKQTGIPKSYLMHLALDEYIRQQRGMDMLEGLKDLDNRLGEGRSVSGGLIVEKNP